MQMKKKYIIGLDGGTQSTKVIIFDLEGNVVCQGKQELNPMFMPRPGVAEHPDDDLWDSIIAPAVRPWTGLQETLNQSSAWGSARSAAAAPA